MIKLTENDWDILTSISKIGIYDLSDIFDRIHKRANFQEMKEIMF